MLYPSSLLLIENDDGSQTYANLLTPVETTVVGSRDKRTVPVVFLMCAGIQTKAKLLLINKIVVEWQIRLKKKRIGTDGCPWYNPSSQSTEIWAFFGSMKRNYDWRYLDADLKGFEGSLHAVMADVFKQRAEKWVRNFFMLPLTSTIVIRLKNLMLINSNFTLLPYRNIPDTV